MSRCKRAFATGCLLLLPATTVAQSVESRRPATPATGERRREPLLDQALRLSTPLLVVRDSERRPGNQHSASSQGKRTAGRRVLGAVVGATGGLFAGGYIGAWIEGDRCHCDDPGLTGALIGAPVGTAVGGILGALYLF
jgi:hypothetical protein